MAATFRPVNVNSPLASEAANAATTGSAGGDVMTPSPAPQSSTPRPSTAPQPDSGDDLTTPTRSTFSPSIGSQQQYPSSAYSESTMTSGGADRSKHPRSHQRDSMEMDIDEDGSPPGTDEGDGSDGESVDADGTRSKKKKSQRFYCTEYPPCALSFTRSEHLARHIRYVCRLHIAQEYNLTSVLGNTPANGRSNATAPDASPGLTTCGSMPRPFT